MDARGEIKRIGLARPGYESLRSEMSHRAAKQQRFRELDGAVEDAGHDAALSEPKSAENAAEIAGLENILSRAEVVDVSRLSGTVIGFGATVTVIDKVSRRTNAWQIVGEIETDPSVGRISILSPIARDLMGKTAGRSLDCCTPSGIASLEVVDVPIRLTSRDD